MTFKFTEDQLMIQEMVRALAQKEFAPLAEELDKTGRFPLENVEKLVEAGLMGLNIPEAYGGAELDEVCKVLAVSEIAKVCASTAELYAVHLLVNSIIDKNGNEEQKKKYLNLACTGKIGAFALTEPNAGSDAGGVLTKAVADGDDYIIDGSKCFISNFGPEEGDYAVVIALTDPAKSTRGGMTAFIIDRDNPGMSLGKTEDKMGIRAAAVSELILTNCRVHKSSILGKVGEGFKIAMSGLDGGRVGIAAQACGVAQGALDAAVKYSKERVQFKKPISANQGIQWYLADMATRTEAAWLLTLKAAELRDRKEPAGMNCSMAKYYAAETAVWVSSKSLQIHGGYGYMKDYAIERMYRDARIIPLYEGTSEVQKMVISKEVLG